MEITEEQFARIEDSLPRQRGNVSFSNLQMLNALLFVAEHGCKWRGLPKRFGNWHTIYTRMSRWSKKGVLDRVFERLQREQIVRIKIEAFALDSTSIKVHPDGTGALKKRATSHPPRRQDQQPSALYRDQRDLCSDLPGDCAQQSVGDRDILAAKWYREADLQRDPQSHRERQLYMVTQRRIAKRACSERLDGSYLRHAAVRRRST